MEDEKDKKSKSLLGVAVFFIAILGLAAVQGWLYLEKSNADSSEIPRNFVEITHSDGYSHHYWNTVILLFFAFIGFLIIIFVMWDSRKSKKKTRTKQKK